jgi:hypothetical protein
MPTILSGFAALTTDPMALTGVVLLVLAFAYAGYTFLVKDRG